MVLLAYFQLASHAVARRAKSVGEGDLGNLGNVLFVVISANVVLFTGFVMWARRLWRRERSPRVRPARRIE